MKPLLLLLPMFVLAALPAGTTAGYTAPFDPHRCAWDATHVVVAFAKSPDTVEIIESWAGDLKPGETIELPDLLWGDGSAVELPHIKVSARALGPNIWRLAGVGREAQFPYLDPVPNRESGVRTVLFLVRRTAPGRPGVAAYRPAARWLEASLVQIEAGRVGTYGQWQGNPGPYTLGGSSMPEADLRRQVSEVARARATFSAALAAGDADMLAAVAARLLQTHPEEFQPLLLDLLERAGPAALPTLRIVVSDDKLWRVHSRAIRALARAGGAEVRPDLARLLAEDVAYWKRVGPGLPVPQPGGTYQYPTPDEGQAQWRVECRLARTEAILAALEPDTLGESRPAVAGLASLWRALPQLAGRGDVAARCAKLLGELPPAPPAPPPAPVAAGPVAAPAVACARPPLVVCPPPVMIDYVPCPPPIVVVPAPCAPRRR